MESLMGLNRLVSLFSLAFGYTINEAESILMGLGISSQEIEQITNHFPTRWKTEDILLPWY